MSDLMKASKSWKLDILNASFLCGTPVLAILGVVWYTMNVGISWAEVSILFVMYLASGLSITAGYHRLFSHRSHSASWPLRLIYAVFGAAAFQNSVIKWCSDHRRHHLNTDSEEDPYSIVRGFFWAHMGWVMISEKEGNIENVEDLQSDPILIWQEKHIFKIGAFAGIIFPGIIGALIIGGVNGFLGGLIWGGLLRLAHLGRRGIKIARHVTSGAQDDPNLLPAKVLPEDLEPLREFLSREFVPPVERFAGAEHCYYTNTATEDYIVDLHPDSDQVAIGAGFSGHGFKLAPVCGRALAELVTVGKCTIPEFEAMRATLSITGP